MNVMFILSLATFTSLAQEEQFITDINDVTEHVSSAKTVSMEINISVTDKESKSIVYTTHAALYRDSLSSLHILGEQEFLRTSKYSVNLDREEKMIMVIENKSHSQVGLQYNEHDIKELLKILEPKSDSIISRKVKIISESDNSVTYKVTGLDGYQSIKLSIDTRNHVIKWIEMFIDHSNQIVRLDYSRFEYDTDISTELNSKNYFFIEGNTVRLAKRYVDYKLFTEL